MQALADSIHRVTAAAAQVVPVRAPRWEPPFPRGVDPAFREALLARTPRAWVTLVLWCATIAPFVPMTLTGVDWKLRAPHVAWTQNANW